MPALVAELKRRRVFRALLGYGVLVFAVLQIIEPVMHGLHWPDVVLSVAVVALALGFPLVALIAATPGIGWRIWRSTPAAPAAEDGGVPSIAVLPFVDLSQSRDQEWMCDGIAEEILHALYAVAGLRIAARGSSFQFKGKNADVRDIGRSLAVATLLEGSVRTAGDKLRVNARLVSRDGYELWSEIFDRDLRDVFAVQEEIARAVVSALRLRLSKDEEGRLQRPGTRDPRAYELYVRGRQLLRSLLERDWDASERSFREAIQLDPSFAEAHAGLADIQQFRLQWLLVPQPSQAQVLQEALAASETALRLGPQLGEAHTAHANLLALTGRRNEAEESFKRAVALSPGYAMAWYFYGRFLFAAGRDVEAAAAFEEAARRDPDEYQALCLLPQIYRKLGDRQRLLDAAHRAAAAVERRLSLAPDDVRAMYLGGGTAIVIGDKERGIQSLERALSLQPRDFSTLYNVACALTQAGDQSRALDLLDRAVDTGRGFRAWMEHDSDLDPLRMSERFQQILARLPP